jgi:23S rRNA pseudouridine1911/1915/1917 synthase
MSSFEYPRPIGPWPRRLQQGVIRKVTADEVERMTVYVDAQLIVLNKPGDIPCHPSKDGPWSSLSGAVRECFGIDAAHLVFRLDRETSGLVVFARDVEIARKLQRAAQERRYAKAYLAILHGELTAEIFADQPLGDDHDSPVAVKSRVVPVGEGQQAQTRYTPLAAANGFTLARVKTETGRKHQIRAHAQWLKYPLVGDKIYGPDPRLFLDFIEQGWTPALETKLLLERQALHCAEIDLRAAGLPHVFCAPLPEDLRRFCRERMGIEPAV